MQDSDSDLEPDFNPQLQSGSGQKAEFDAEAPPGSRATTVRPGAWWADSFPFCMQLGSSLVSLSRVNTKSLLPRPNGRGTVTFLAKASAISQGVQAVHFDKRFRPKEDTVPERRQSYNSLFKIGFTSGGHNAALRRFACSSLCQKFIGELRNSLEVMVAWSDCEPVTSEAMGRSASKVEDIEAAQGLASLEDGCWCDA